MPKVCIFCDGGPPFSKEHVLPEWTARLIGVGRLAARGKRLDEKAHSWQSVGTFGLVTKDVCRRCNGTWMSDLENLVKPILTPLILGTSPAKLTPDAQVAIAAWLWKIAILHERAGTMAYFTKDERVCLMDGDAPPEQGVHMWIGAYAGDRVAIIRGGASSFTAPNGVVFPGTVMTLALRHFAAQLLCIRELHFLPPPRVVSQFDVADVLNRIWPENARAVEWPPVSSLGDGAFRDLHHRWNSRAADQRLRRRDIRW